MCVCVCVCLSLSGGLIYHRFSLVNCNSNWRMSFTVMQSVMKFKTLPREFYKCCHLLWASLKFQWHIVLVLNKTCSHHRRRLQNVPWPNTAVGICVTYPAKCVARQSTITSRNVTVERIQTLDHTSAWTVERVSHEQIFCVSMGVSIVDNSRMNAVYVPNVLHVPICCRNTCGYTGVKFSHAPTVVKHSPGQTVCARMPSYTVAKRTWNVHSAAAALRGPTISKLTWRHMVRTRSAKTWPDLWSSPVNADTLGLRMFASLAIGRFHWPAVCVHTSVFTRERKISHVPFAASSLHSPIDSCYTCAYTLEKNLISAQCARSCSLGATTSNSTCARIQERNRMGATFVANDTRRPKRWKNICAYIQESDLLNVWLVERSSHESTTWE